VFSLYLLSRNGDDQALKTARVRAPFSIAWIVLFESSVLPVIRVTVEMHDSHDGNDIRLDAEQDAEGKSLRETPTDIPFDKWVKLRAELNPVKGVLNGCEESLPEGFLL